MRVLCLLIVAAAAAAPASGQGSLVGLSPVAAEFDQTKAPAQPAAPAAEQSAPAADPARPAAGTPTPPPPENYTYDPAGRRDPFLSLMNSGVETRGTTSRTDGVASMTVAEVSLRGVVEARGEMIGMIKGPDNKTYLVHKGDKLLDGTIQSITPQGLVILQEVNDPLSLVKQREVRKMLRAVEDGKE